MYGIVNKAVHGLVTENFGENAWNDIKKESGIDVDYFISNEPYDDEITYKLVQSSSKVLKMSEQDVLIAFGEYWILKTGQKHYGSLMQSGGNSLMEFIINLPDFHSRVMLIYPKLTPPEFKITDVSTNSLLLHYYSHRAGLKYFVYGLLLGLGKMFNASINIQIINSKDEGHTHDEFKVTMN